MDFKDITQGKYDNIINAAFEMFAKHGYKKTSMADIAAAAGVSKSVLFKYFSTKDNLYETIFKLACRSIEEADKAAIGQSTESADLFTLMRLSARFRLSLFKAHPWVFEFSFTAFFDDDPFVQNLVGESQEHHLIDDEEKEMGLGIPSSMNPYYKNLRKDISSDDARQLILWVSTGYLKETLNNGDIDQEKLEKGYGKWIGIFEKLLSDPSKETGQKP